MCISGEMSVTTSTLHTLRESGSILRKSIHTRSIGPELWMFDRAAALCGRVFRFMYHSRLTVCLNI